MSAAKKKTTAAGHRPPGRPRRLEESSKINTDQQILQQARLLFAARGFSAVSVNDIVSAAQISKPTLYYYFPDKEALYAAVLTEIIEGAGQYLRLTLQTDCPLRQKLEAVTEGFFEHSPVALPCLLRDVCQHLSNPHSPQILELYRAQVYQPFEALFRRAIADGDLHASQNPHMLSELFLTMLDWLTLRFSFHEGPPLKPEEKARQVVRLFMEGFGPPERLPLPSLVFFR